MNKIYIPTIAIIAVIVAITSFVFIWEKLYKNLEISREVS